MTRTWIFVSTISGSDLGPAGNILLFDTVYGRSQEYHKIFVSSQMRGSVLKAEREAAVQAINALFWFRSWSWEHDAAAGPYSSEAVCLVMIGGAVAV